MQKRGPHRSYKDSELSISELVPGERTLSRQSIDRWKSNIAAGKFEQPSVVETLHGHLVTQGNHRVFAAKELGQRSVMCKIAQIKRQANVETQDDSDCRDAIRDGLRGFEALKIVSTDRDREKACPEEAFEDDPILDDALDDLEEPEM